MHRRKQVLYRLCVLAALSVFLISAISLAEYFLEARKSESRYTELAEMAAAIPTPAPSSVPEETTVPPTLPAVDAFSEPTILPEYQSLYALNPHMVGWLRIEGTVINYPVVQTPEDPEYYLHRDFDGTANPRGCIFADGACNVDSSQNVTLYGHHMVDGSMFAGLLDYDSRSFWEAYPTIRFDSLTQRRTYRIFAVFRTTADTSKGFPYHTFVQTDDPAAFDAFVTRCKALSCYDTGITPAYGDQILCLSTCEYHKDNGRFVVAAVLQK